MKAQTAVEAAQEIGDWIRESGDEGSRLWDIIGALRGPDSPSERPDMGRKEAAEAYHGRVARKMKTVAVIRAVAIGQVGGARTRKDTKVTLPPHGKWDHFDKHVERAARALGLKVEIEQ